MRPLLAVLVLVLAGCEEAQEVSRSAPREVEGTQGCHKFSYCYTCSPGFDMKLECKFKMSTMCPGSEPVIRQVSTVTYRYPSKPDETWTSEEGLVLRVTGPCR